MLFKVKPKGLLQKYDEEIDGEQRKSFVLGKKKLGYSHLLIIEVLKQEVHVHNLILYCKC